MSGRIERFAYRFPRVSVTVLIVTIWLVVWGVSVVAHAWAPHLPDWDDHDFI